MNRYPFFILYVFLLASFLGCKKDQDEDLMPENTRISGRVLSFGANSPAVPGAIRIAIFEEEEAAVGKSPAQTRLLQSFETDQDGNFSLGLNTSRHPRFKYYAQIITKVDKHFDPSNYKFYFDAGQTQQLNLYHYPQAWLRLKVLPKQPGVGYNLNISFSNGSDYDIWGVTPFETTELLFGNSNQWVNVTLSRQFSESVSYSFNKYLPAFDTLEHVIEY